ncbi:hypothetical protein [Klenkia marina]|uniref:hypothetical protein n=1 Tax=Klenkia marina TaxID=1960309 RepID=UPI00105A6F4A|nr:hypothetical protein [Klenkia marina]
MHWTRTFRSAPPFVGALLLGALALLDFVAPTGRWWAEHPMSAAGLTALVGFAAAGFFLDGWLQEREARRLKRVSTVAYRSLAQFVNDAGRHVVGPVSGADLSALGIPGAAPEDVVRFRGRLRDHGLAVEFRELSGSWSASADEVDDRLAVLLGDTGFVQDLFLAVARSRRRLQEGTALWAPVMLTSRNCADDLGRLQEVTDELELLQERLRASGLVGLVPLVDLRTVEWAHDVRAQYLTTIRCYERLRDDFARLSALPSDAVVRRRSRLPVEVPAA